MFSIFLVVSREFLEAVLVISIISAFLNKNDLYVVGRKFLVMGIVSGIAMSAILAAAFYQIGTLLDGRALLYFEAGLFLASAVLMIQMLWWMRRIGSKFHIVLSKELSESWQRLGYIGVALVSCLGIAREGAEAATYIYSLSLSGQVSFIDILFAVGIGAVIAWLVYLSVLRGFSKLSLPRFFTLTSLFLFFTAGALIMDAVARLTELDVLPTLIPVVWNSSHLVAPHSWLGKALSLLVGYRPTPSLMMVLVYGTYWFVILGTYYRPQIFKRFRFGAIQA